MMKRLTMLIVILALGWSAYWGIGFLGISKGYEAWFEERRAEGWVAEYDDLSVFGFPNRFDSTFTNLTLADPRTGVAWDAPFFQIFSLSYQPNHLIAIWPPEQTLAVPTEKLGLNTTDMRASLVLEPGADLKLNRANIALEDVELTSTANWQLSASGIDLAMHSVPEVEATYRIALRAEDLVPPSTFRLSSNGTLPGTFSTFQADIQASFDRPWDRLSLEQERPQPTELSIKLASVEWGELKLNAAGNLRIDAAGVPTGKITIRAVNWRKILKVARSSGQVSPALVDTIEQGLSLLARASGNGKELEVPLRFKDGALRVGPLRLGPAPRIILR